MNSSVVRFQRIITTFVGVALAVSLAAADAGKWSEPVFLANLQDKAITESSGIVASRRTPGVYWTHNDSDNPADMFAFDRLGNALATFHVTSATNVDWEDIAAGPGTGEDAVIYMGDIGDNYNNRSVARTECAIYRIWEPAVDPAKRGVVDRTMIAERYPFVYPDGPHDAETLLCDPKTNDLYVIKKDDSGISNVYRYPMPLKRDLKVTLEKVAMVTFTNPLRFRGRNVGKLATGGDISPDRTKIAIRTYTDGFEWTIAPGQTIAQALMGQPAQISVPWIGQYEGICYSLDGKSLLTTSEGSPCPLWEIKRK